MNKQISRSRNIFTHSQRLRESGINAKVFRQVLLISFKNKKCCLNLVKIFIKWASENWKHFFYDESKFKLKILVELM